MRGPGGERLGDLLEGEDDYRVRSVAIVVEDDQGRRRPGFMLRAGDFIERTDYTTMVVES